MGLRKLWAASRLLTRRPEVSGAAARSWHASSSVAPVSASCSCEGPAASTSGLSPVPLSVHGENNSAVYAASLVHQIRHGNPYTGGHQWARAGGSTEAGQSTFGNPMMYFACGGVLGASLGVFGYAGIANMKMRDWESTLVQAWKSRVGGTNVWEALSLPNSLSSMAGLFARHSEQPSASYRQQASLPLGPHSLADAAAKAAPAVVNVTMQSSSSAIFNGASSGSGVILDPDGTILTNAHIVAEASAERLGGMAGTSARTPVVHVALQDGRVFEGQVISSDRLSDLAIVKIASAEPLPSARLGASAGLRVGEWVLALGSPLHLQNSVTAGIVSCVDRKGVELGLAGPNTEFIQTDAAINSGNSGGPLVNLAGEVVGISSMKALTADGVSFAIPIDTAKHVVQQLKQNGRVVRPYIGIKMLQLNESKAQQLKRADPSFPAVKAGILVPQVSPASPAHRAGLRPGDVIIGYGGQQQASTSGLIRALGEQVGKPLALQVVRPGSAEQITIQVTAMEATT